MLASELITALTEAINATTDLPLFASVDEKSYFIKSLRAMGKDNVRPEILVIDLVSMDEKCECPKCRIKSNE